MLGRCHKCRWTVAKGVETVNDNLKKQAKTACKERRLGRVQVSQAGNGSLPVAESKVMGYINRRELKTGSVNEISYSPNWY